MTPDHLLPSNSTPLEQALSNSTDLLVRLGRVADQIAGFKIVPADDLLPWLIWEYGLGELLPYLPDPRRAITEGILWQRLRGTPAALAIAMSWIGATARVEQEPPGVHFAEFQFDPGFVLEDAQAIANLIAIAQLSAPVRARLSRIYHGYDLRRFMLDDSRLGDALLSDHSGVWRSQGQVKISFGRGHADAVDGLAIPIASNRNAARFATARLLDRYLLDFSVLGDAGHQRFEEILHSHLFTLANDVGLANPNGMLPERRYCRAMVVLSDGPVLGETNGNLPRFYWQEEGNALALGDGEGLSGTPHRLTRRAVLERLDSRHADGMTISDPFLAKSRQAVKVHFVQARADLNLGTLRLGETIPSLDRSFLHRLHERINPPLPDAAGWRVRLYQKAQLTLSEAVLGDIDGRTPRSAVLRTIPIPLLGDLTLGNTGAEIRHQTLTEMFWRVSTLDKAEVFSFGPGHSTLQRMLTHSSQPLDVLPKVSRESLSRKIAQWCGQTWTGTRWPKATWRNTREIVSSTFNRQTA